MLLTTVLTVLSVLLSATGDKLRDRHDGLDKSDTTLAALVERLGTLESIVKHQDRRINELEEARNRQLSLIENMKQTTTTQEKRAASRRRVAFSSYLDHPMHNVQIDQIIRFNKLLLNDGNCYNAKTGIFSAPVSGTYLFTYTVNTYVTSYQLVVKLVVDGVNESDAISDPFHSAQEIQGVGTVILHVDAGKAVWLAPYNTANVTVDGRKDYRFSTFSGVLLYQ